MKNQDSSYLQTWAEINLGNLNHNLKKIRTLISDNVKVLATVKANAYGHGIIKISKFLEDKVDILGVASLNEAMMLKKENIKTDILIMGNTLPDGLKQVIEYNLTSTVTEEESVFLLDDIAEKEGKVTKVHVKIDTGMGRIGFWHKEAADVIKRINKLKNVKIEGLFTHLSSAESDREFSLKQLERFNKVIKQIEDESIDIPFYHAANSMATLHYKESHFNLIRPGLIMYGVYPDIECERTLDVKPLLSLKSKIIYLKEAEPGRSISYGREYVTSKKIKVATIPIGYADGYTYLLTHKARVSIRGNYAPVIGRICMDQIMVDVTNIKDISIGDNVTLIGLDGKSKIIAEELAESAGTIPYEILCWISQRVIRCYIK